MKLFKQGGIAMDDKKQRFQEPSMNKPQIEQKVDTEDCNQDVDVNIVDGVGYDIQQFLCRCSLNERPLCI